MASTDNGSEFINYHLLAWCEERKLTFTRSRPGNCNDGAHVEEKNWAVALRARVGYHRYDTPAELLLLSKIWAMQSHLTNYFLAQQKVDSTRHKPPERVATVRGEPHFAVRVTAQAA